MGLDHTGIVASAVGSVAAMVVVLAMGLLALVVVRRARHDTEPLFPEIEQEHSRTADPVAFTEQLTAGGTVADDVTRAGAVASAAGFEQAYALLALVDGDTNVTADVPPVAVADPYAQLATIDEPALAAFAADAPDMVTDIASDVRTPVAESLDTLLPPVRPRRLRTRTA